MTTKPSRSQADYAAKADELEELAALIMPYSGIRMANNATRGEVSRWLRERAEIYRTEVPGPEEPT